MCWSGKKKYRDVCSIYNQDGEINVNANNETTLELPEHNDDPFLNRNVQYGILGFRYETQNSVLIVYTSIQAKTFCMIMHLSPV